MKRFSTKWAALLVSGGLMLQLGACLPVVLDLLLRPAILNAIDSGLDDLDGTEEADDADDN